MFRPSTPATDHVEGMNDLWLRPRMLRSLVRDRLPDEKRPSPSPAELAAVLSYVKNHNLLSEALPDTPPDRKLAEAWTAAVDAWVDRLLSLVSCNVPDKCWAAICLLGVTCEECSSHRFLASYSLWFQKLLSNIQPPSSTHFVRVASCASLVDLFTRLARFTNLKKDATSLAGKLIQPALQLLNENATDAEGAVDLLCTIMSFFPASMHRHLDSAEAVLVSKIMSAKCNQNLSKKLACCLALLPKMRGDEDSWCLMMHKIVIAVNNLLSDAFQGIEEESKSSEISRMLVPPGKDPPPPLGGQSMSKESSEQATKRLHELLLPRVSALMHSCCIMLTNPYPIQVTVPVRPLLALIWRVLTMDGSLHESLLPFTTSLQQELLCSVLPVLHLDSLDLLIAVIKGVRSQLLPHAANVVRHLTEYFRRSSMPSIRIKLYSILQTLLISLGVGMALYLTQDVINNAFADLNDCPASDLMSSGVYSKLGNAASVQSSHRKRKHAFGLTNGISNGFPLEVVPVSGKPETPVSVKIAALRALEALLSVGGSLQSEGWRSNVDLLLINVATHACMVGWANEGKCVTAREDSTQTRAEFQLAALQALLASLLSPAPVRPPYISQGLELFRQGKQQTGTKLAAFCAHALLALEVLIHPRSLPLDDYPVARNSTFDEGFGHKVPETYGGEKLKTPLFSKGDLGVIDNLDDEFYTVWLKSNDQETVVDAGNKNQEVNSEQPEHVPVDSAPGHVDAEGNQLSHNVDARMQLAGDEDMGEPNGNPNSSGGIRVSADMERVSLDESAMDPAGVSVNEEDASKSLAADVGSRNETAPSQGNMVSSNANLNRAADDDSESLVASTKWEDTKPSYGSDTDSLGSLPDIVDADPDTD